MTVAWIIGLGNPGAKYAATRHNAGFWLCDELVRHYGGGPWLNEGKFFGEVSRVVIAGREVKLLKPDTFMNRSGQAAQAVAQFYKLQPEQLLVVHDELDLPPGEVKLKQGGGHGGHNGLRDISAQLGADYPRLRVGIGHPGHRDQVVNYVLARASLAEQQAIDGALARAVDVLPTLLRDGVASAMNVLNGARKKAKATDSASQAGSAKAGGRATKAAESVASKAQAAASRPANAGGQKAATLKDLWPLKPRN